jgi:hypothetical protein
MTRNEILEVCNQFYTGGNVSEREVAFARYMMKYEREACAKVCEDGINNATDWDSSVWDQACENRAFAIRTRGKA